MRRESVGKRGEDMCVGRGERGGRGEIEKVRDGERDKESEVT
jgi:hypothetical protein